MFYKIILDTSLAITLSVDDAFILWTPGLDSVVTFTCHLKYEV